MNMERNKWFGKSWAAPICDPAFHVPTPVGELCASCNKLIEADDQGMLINHLDQSSQIQLPHHLDCFMQTIIPDFLYGTFEKNGE